MLLADPRTAWAARDALALAERADAAAWPFAASVGLRTVALRWAAVAGGVPEPEAPWAAGRDGRMWFADRAELRVDEPTAVGGCGSSGCGDGGGGYGCEGDGGAGPSTNVEIYSGSGSTWTVIGGPANPGLAAGA